MLFILHWIAAGYFCERNAVLSGHETQDIEPRRACVPVTASVSRRDSDSTTVLMLSDEDETLLPGDPIVDPAQAPQVPGCHLLTVLGSGGMGTVYLARQENLERLVAVKVLNAKYASEPNFIRRLTMEAKTMGALCHPNIVSCHDIVNTPSGLCIIMEYIPGKMTGRDLVLRFGPIPQAVTASILLQVARGLEYIYNKGFSHRDLKPDNLLFQREGKAPAHKLDDVYAVGSGRVSICDFGIAVNDHKYRQGIDDKVLGSPAFMAPEQACTPQQVDFRADIYALGATAYFMLCGKAPFDGHDRETRIALKVENDIPLPELPNGARLRQEFARVLRKMGAAHPDDRYQNYADLLKDLETLELLYASQRLRRSLLRQHSFLLGLAIGIGAIVFAGIGLTFLYYWQLEREERAVSRTISMIFWEGERDSWRILPRDAAVDVPSLLGFSGSDTLMLRETLDNAQEIAFSFRLSGSGTARFAVTDGQDVRAAFALSRHAASGLVSVTMLSDGREVPIADIPNVTANLWVTMQVAVLPSKVLLYINRELYGIGPLRSPLTAWRFRTGEINDCLFQIKDFYVRRRK